ncbi:MAG: methylaspartate ammonia-lyase [Bacillota bacterium]|nr:methylaspartate ammonia-lyase [Bacillota bacterium]
MGNGVYIERAVLSAGLSGFYFDDQKAIKAGAEHDGFAYRGEPLTPGFRAVRQAGESVSVQLLLSDGQVAYGDCAAVQYSGVDGRDPVFVARDFLPLLERVVVPRLTGLPADTFRANAEALDRLATPDGRRLHTAIRYGVTQALLDAAARARHLTMAEVIAAEYRGAYLPTERVPIFGQTGDDRYLNADKLIIKRADVLPHGLINNVTEKLGARGEILAEYVRWLNRRIREIGGEDYRPTIHLDVYGTLGLAFDNDLDRIVQYLAELERLAHPYHLRLEGPVDAGGKQAQMDVLAELCHRLHDEGIKVEIVADEWCNTYEDVVDFTAAGAGDMVQIKTPDLGGINNSIEAVLYCKTHGMGAYLGGTCNETERSAQVCVHVALATRPVQMLAKPGMGVDEALAVVYNEMQRTIALVRARRKLDPAKGR